MSDRTEAVRSESVHADNTVRTRLGPAHWKLISSGTGSNLSTSRAW